MLGLVLHDVLATSSPRFGSLSSSTHQRQVRPFCRSSQPNASAWRTASLDVNGEHGLSSVAGVLRWERRRHRQTAVSIRTSCRVVNACDSADEEHSRRCRTRPRLTHHFREKGLTREGSEALGGGITGRIEAARRNLDGPADANSDSVYTHMANTNARNGTYHGLSSDAGVLRWERRRHRQTAVSIRTSCRVVRVNACTGADAERSRQRRARLRMTHHFREGFDERGFGGVGRRDLGAN